MKYTLYLDESGNFEDNGKTYKPSIVAGYLFSGDGLTEESARNIMYEVKCSKLIFSNIDIKHFHGMESIDDNTVEIWINYEGNPTVMYLFNYDGGIVTYGR